MWRIAGGMPFGPTFFLALLLTGVVVLWMLTLERCAELERAEGAHVPLAGWGGVGVVALALLLGGWPIVGQLVAALGEPGAPLISSVLLTVAVCAALAWLGFAGGVGVALAGEPREQPIRRR